MILERFEVPGLSQYSYLVASGGVAAVIDPKRDVDAYLKFAEGKDLRIEFVLETHIHADYASGARALAFASGAELCLSGHDEDETYAYAFPHREMRDGDEITLGELTLGTLHTPGHTPEHISFLLSEGSRGGEPLALFSGDLLFVGSVGRPDLLGPEEQRKLAKSLFRSLRQLDTLPDGMQVFPGHGAGSLCGTGISQRAQTTLGYERASNPFLRVQCERAFVDAVLHTLPEFPDYYRRMKEVNSAGPALLSALPGCARLGLDEFALKRESLDATVVDLRRPEAFGGAHIPGSISIGAGPNVSSWAAWVLPYDKPILLVGDGSTDLDEARRALIRVGLDSVVGSLRGGMAAWIESGNPQEHLEQISVVALQRVLASRSDVRVLDVRSPGEWKSGHIKDAIHISAGELSKRVCDLPMHEPLYIVCGSGYRSSVASSIAARAGRARIVNVAGGMKAWKNQRLAEVAAQQGQTNCLRGNERD